MQCVPLMQCVEVRAPGRPLDASRLILKFTPGAGTLWKVNFHVQFVHFGK